MNNFVNKQVAKALLVVGLMLSQGVVWAAVPPTVNISTMPLFSGRGNVHPNLILDLSVEYPTVGAAYRSSYDKTTEYLGYFNSKKCYTYPMTEVSATNAAWELNYVNSGTSIYKYKGSSGTPVYRTSNFNWTTGNKGSVAGYLNGYSWKESSSYEKYFKSASGHPATSSYTAPDLTEANGYFRIEKVADANHECGGDAFSGNFMNWASSSSIDMLRYALTGGDRVIDTATETVLQRAYLRDDPYNALDSGTFYANGSHFPRKSVNNASTVTPFSASPLYVVSCRDRILFSNTNYGGDCDTQRVENGVLKTSDKYLGEYLARVKVCDSNEGATRTDLCGKYGGNYKPEGDLQRYSDKIRAGAFGYLTEHDTGNNNLYGGVLRAPVKYVGATKFEAPGFGMVNNDMPEWDKSTGVLYPDPIGAPENLSSTNHSGVINYLNKFGRTNSSAKGIYKVTDPVGELYYESIRYLQGRKPTGNGATTTSRSTTNPFSKLGTSKLDDNFPVYTSWVNASGEVTSSSAPDPITASCQNNYIVTIGDVNTHRDGYIPGSKADGSDHDRLKDSGDTTWPELEVSVWAEKISDMETSGAAGNLAPRSRLTGLHTRTDAGASYGTYNMAGLAYWANTHDIRLDKPTRVKTFMIDVDEGGNGSMETDNPRSGGSGEGIKDPRNSQFYLAAKYGGFLDKGDSTSANTDWQPDGNPFWTFAANGKTSLNNNTEWTGASEGTDPSNYFLASQPEKLINAIHNIFKVVSSNSGTISGVTLTSTRIATDNAYVYQPGFDPSKWSGSVLKLEMSYDEEAGTVEIQDTAYPTWDAGIVLTGKEAVTKPPSPAVAANPAPANRKIYTATSNEDGSLNTVEFKWGSLTAAQQTYLNTSPVLPYEADDLGEQRVSYLRGVRSDEIGYPDGVFRTRDRVLGDIINSNPTWVGPPAAYVRGEGYKSFYDTYKDTVDAQGNVTQGRAPAVYVGSNDGMLHAFHADNGVELFAYVPNAVIAGLNQLTDPTYVHRPYVDGQMNVLEAEVGGGWKTILASGMGGGAQGAFVLDVTNPASFSTGLGAIWEFTDHNDGDMGNLMSPPVVAKFRVGTGGDGLPEYKHFVVVPSGFNNYQDDGHKSETGEGALFLLSLDKPATEAWLENKNYYKFNTPVKDVSDKPLPNGLSTPGFVVGGDGAVRFAYAGDAQGNLWRFDFTGEKPWTGALNTTPLFTAKDASGQRQPITQEPKIVFAPGGGYVVLFGTGKFIDNADVVARDFQTQSFYAIYDTTKNTVSGRTQLAERELADYNSDGNDAFTVTGVKFNYGVPTETGSAVKMGWYLDFPGSGTGNADACSADLADCGTGERSVTTALVAYGNLFFNSLITGNNPCEKGGGRTYGVCALSGFPFDGSGNCITDGSGITGYISEVGMLSSPVLFDVGTIVGTRDSLGQRTVSKKYAVFNFGTGGKAGTASAAKGSGGEDFTGVFYPQAGRSSWREVLNYEELRKEAGY